MNIDLLRYSVELYMHSAIEKCDQGCLVVLECINDAFIKLSIGW